MNKRSLDSLSHTALISILMLFGYLLLMFGNGLVSLTHPDEVFYVQTAKEMITHRSWMTPYIFDQPQFEKPVLFFWLLRAAIQAFGVTPFVARFWPAFFAIAGVLATYAIAWMLFNDKKIAFASGIVLCSSFIYIALARAVLTDMVFSVLVVISLAFFCYGYRYPRRKGVGIILCLVVSGLAVLAKGVLGLCFPAAVIGGYLFAMKDLRFLKCRATVIGLVLFAAIAVPWHVLMVKLYGNWFVYEYLFNVHFRRLLDAEHPKCDTWYFYPGVMVGGIMPWTLFFFPALGAIIRKLRAKDADSPMLAFLFVWIAGVFVFVQPAHSKLASYIFPAIPALAIMVGYFLGKAMGGEGTLPRQVKGTGYLLSILLALVTVAGLVISRRYIDFLVSMVPIYAFAGVLAVTLILIVCFARRDKIPAMVFSVPGIAVALFVLLALGKPYAEPWVSCQEICDVFKKIDRSDATVLASKFYVRGVRFYTDRPMAVIDINGKGFFSPHPIPFLNTEDKVLAFLGQRPVTYGVVKKANYEDLVAIVQKGPFTMEFLEEMGGKKIVRIVNNIDK